MIQLDPRSGSGELLPYFSAYDVGVSCEDNLDYGDACFWGNGPESPLFIGFERKTLGTAHTDMIASMREHRLDAFQLKGLVEIYDVRYLIVEGIWRCGKGGSIEVPSGNQWIPFMYGSRAVSYRELDHYIGRLQHVFNFHVERTANREQTAAFIVSRFKLWNENTWEENVKKISGNIYTPNLPLPDAFVRRGLSVPQPTPAVIVAAAVPGVRKKAWEFGKVFECPWDLVNADVTELAKVKGFALPSASKMYRWFRDKKRSSV